MALLRVRELLRSVSGHAILRWARHWSSPGMAPYRAALRVLSCLVTDSRPARPLFSRVADLREGYKASPARPALPSGLLCCALSVPMAVMDPPSTLKPAQVAVAMVESGMVKHRTRADLVFFKAVLAGVMLSYGGLLSEIVGGGSAGINATNPGLVKLLSGAVFPVGLVMIVLQGHELLTSNMMVRTACACTAVYQAHLRRTQIFPMAIIKGAVPWWGLPWNWLIGARPSSRRARVSLSQCRIAPQSRLGTSAAASSSPPSSPNVRVQAHQQPCPKRSLASLTDTGIISTEPYISYAQTFALHKAKEPAWYQIFLRGIGCNWLVCVAVWQAAGARDTLSKIVAIWIPIMIFVTAAYDHVIANMFSVPLGILFGADLTVAEYIRKSLIASYLGNVVGALLVALPACYFFLGDYCAGGLRGVEEGGGEAGEGGGGVGEGRDGSGGKERPETFEVLKRAD
ncbi:hypothetical protein AcV7_004072 [Taiwanofungus camphoratus]|nr:hypothetical protein AcV7_004072 [Antrodia cinnamomea]